MPLAVDPGAAGAAGATAASPTGRRRAEIGRMNPGPGQVLEVFYSSFALVGVRMRSR